MKHCNKCGNGLVVGDNWTEYRRNHYSYTCGPCETIRRNGYARDNCKQSAEKKRESNKKYYYANQSAQQARSAEWRRNNKAKHNANCARHRAIKSSQTPSWYCNETVTEIYEVAREFGYEVDHIVPLSKGGLHSHENLQLLTKSENVAKGARECWM